MVWCLEGYCGMTETMSEHDLKDYKMDTIKMAEHDSQDYKINTIKTNTVKKDTHSILDIRESCKSCSDNGGMRGWKECELADIAEVQTGPFGSQFKNEQYITGGTPVVTVEHINNFRINDFKYPSVTEQDKARLSRYLLKTGDIVFTRVGSVDLSAHVNQEQNGWMFSSRMLRVRPNDKVNSRFLSYFFQQKSFRDYILNISVGATMPSINTEILKGIPVSYPPLPEQHAIASVLSSLDDKIDLLHRQNKTLEAMAETLFRQWFVEEADAGWEEKPISFFGNIICGKTPSKQCDQYFGGNIPFIKIPDMHERVYVMSSSDTLTEEGKSSQPNKTLPSQSICVSCIATVGLVALNAYESQTNQQINSIIPRQVFYRFFLYLSMKSSVDLLHSMASGGTATANLNTGDFSRISLPFPGDNKLNKFHSDIEPVFAKILFNQTQIRTLEKLRDTLLPKLMSGEVRVNNV